MACDICGRGSGHENGCPYQDDDYSVFECEECGEEIFESDEYFEVDGAKLCKDCFENIIYDKHVQIAHREDD